MKQLSLDYQAGMRSKAECHHYSSDMKSRVANPRAKGICSHFSAAQSASLLLSKWYTPDSNGY